MTDSSDILWPEDLPQSPLSDGFQETLPDNTLRSKMEQGPAKLRRRGTDASGKITMLFLLSAAQCTSLDIFYQNTLSGGSLRFCFKHPRRQHNVMCRMMQPPEYIALNGGYYRAKIVMEVLA